MGLLCCLPCKIIWKIVDGVSSFGTIFFCIPLSLFSLIICLLFGSYGLLGLYTILSRVEHYTVETYFEITESALLILTAFCALLAVLTLVSFIAVLAKSFYKTLLLFSFINFVREISHFIWRGLKDSESSNLKEKAIMSAIHMFLVLFASFWITSCFNSLSKVFSAGGSGWEGVNHETIRKRKRLGRNEHVSVAHSSRDPPPAYVPRDLPR